MVLKTESVSLANIGKTKGHYRSRRLSLPGLSGQVSCRLQYDYYKSSCILLSCCFYVIRYQDTCSKTKFSGRYVYFNTCVHNFLSWTAKKIYTFTWKVKKDSSVAIQLWQKELDIVDDIEVHQCHLHDFYKVISLGNVQ